MFEIGQIPVGHWNGRKFWLLH